MRRPKSKYFLVLNLEGQYIQEGSTNKKPKFGDVEKAKLFTEFESSVAIEAHRTTHGEILREEFIGRLPRQ